MPRRRLNVTKAIARLIRSIAASTIGVEASPDTIRNDPSSAMVRSIAAMDLARSTACAR